jgi:Rps23 Pro-64 3,4-dihydroxylase Tpa1-like proline 4-hydroxylase
MAFKLSSALRPDDIRQQFRDHGFAHVARVLPDENARRIRKVMLDGTQWSLVLNDGEKHVDISPAQLHLMNAGQAARLQQAVYGRAQSHFQYLYDNYPIYDAFKSGLDKGHLLQQFYEWMNCAEFLEFARIVTGFDDIAYADAQATRFRPGHFLSRHDDSAVGKNRRAAYVFNFSLDWSADWGGYLQLLDEHGHIRHGILPTFNSLNVLAVPQMHNVSLVTPFAGGMRFAITGWLRYGDSPL